MIKRVIAIILFGLTTGTLIGQTFSPEVVSLGNFVRRMFEASPFEGVKVIEDYNNTYLISVVMLERSKYNNEIVMNKVATAKARSNVGKFLNGTQITTDFIVQTEERKSDTIRTEVITYDIIREKSAGMVDALETLVNFNTNEDKYFVFILFKEYNNLKNK